MEIEQDWAKWTRLGQSFSKLSQKQLQRSISLFHSCSLYGFPSVPWVRLHFQAVTAIFCLELWARNAVFVRMHKWVEKKSLVLPKLLLQQVIALTGRIPVEPGNNIW